MAQKQGKSLWGRKETVARRKIEIGSAISPGESGNFTREAEPKGATYPLAAGVWHQKKMSWVSKVWGPKTRFCLKRNGDGSTYSRLAAAGNYRCRTNPARWGGGWTRLRLRGKEP